MKLLVLLGFLSVILLGCKEEPAPPTEHSHSEHTDENSAEDEEQQTSNEGIPYKLNLEPPGDEEVWLLYVSQEQAEVPTAMVHLKKTGDQYAIHVGAISEQQGQLTLAEGSATDETVSMLIHGKDAGYSFQGKLQGGIIWGNTILPSGLCVPSRMIRPGEMLEAPPEPSPFEGQADFQKVIQADVDWDSLQSFIEQNPRSPYVINAFYGLFVQCGPRQMSNEEFDAFFHSIDRSTGIWGERMQEYLKMSAILRMAEFYSYPELVSQKLATIDGIPDDKVWEEILQRMKEGVEKRIDLALRIEQIPNLEPELRAETLQQLPEEIEANRFDPFLLAKLGDVLAKIEYDELAAEYYTKLVAIPGLEAGYLQLIGPYREKLGSVSDRLESVWKRLHSDDLSGLSEFKLQAYKRFIDEFEVDLSDISFDSDAPNLLIELFTGTACPPCIAADISCSILSNKLPAEHFTVLQYHLHTPGPDPLTNADSEARFFSYSGSGTPAVFLNGRALNSLGGSPPAIPANVNTLLTEVRKELKLKPSLQIELSANRSEQNQISFNTNVVTDSLSSRWRLIVVLAEDQIHFTGPNGVPIHEMVVRKILTPPLGALPQDEQLAWSGTINLDKLKKDLNEFLSQDEKKYQYQFPERPLDLQELHLVAFVQDQQNRRIRQVQSIPVPSAADSADAGDK